MIVLISFVKLCVLLKISPVSKTLSTLWAVVRLLSCVKALAFLGDSHIFSGLASSKLESRREHAVGHHIYLDQKKAIYKTAEDEI